MRTKLVVGLIALCAAQGLFAADDLPVFKLGVSEYPSWSLFLTASDQGLIDGRAGKVGPIEKKWGVDIELKDTDYDTTITMYGGGQIDAGCLTDMDSLAPSLSKKAVAIMPTSTSDGADQCIVAKDIKTVADLKGVKVYGLDNSVSRYCFDRNIELAGDKPDAFNFVNQDPAAATMAMSQGQKTHRAIIVWNPFCMTLKKQNKDVHVLFDSTKIKGEIIDMVTMSRASLEKKGGKEFACAVIDTYYTFCKMLDNPETAEKTLTALGSRFAKMDAESMKTIVKETSFYSTPEKGLAVFEGAELKKIMEKVNTFCVNRKIVEKAPSIGYGDDPKADLCFDPQYIKTVVNKK
jgi:ABC-type nitrate/sulfonate/bicarbonate transport system substrate-binding protein